MKLILILSSLWFITACSLFTYNRQKMIEECILEMVERDVPVDLAEEKCKKIYGNIHSEYRDRDRILGDRRNH